ncbi:hypothetical protein EDF36_1434 [Rathayibacter sp. PhB152]|nr:hypothetical protein EDF36_1434 [Rathayibacter sp. PhB152]
MSAVLNLSKDCSDRVIHAYHYLPQSLEFILRIISDRDAPNDGTHYSDKGIQIAFGEIE